jgi:hypothetical protein
VISLWFVVLVSAVISAAAGWLMRSLAGAAIGFDAGGVLTPLILGSNRPVYVVDFSGWDWKNGISGAVAGAVLGVIAGFLLDLLGIPVGGIVFVVLLSAILYLDMKRLLQAIGAGLMYGVPMIILALTLASTENIIADQRLPAVVIGCALIGAVLIGFFRGDKTPRLETWTIPNQGMRRTVLTAVPLTAAVCIVVIAVGAASQFIPFIALYAWLIFGGASMIKHVMLRYVLYRAGYIPWNYARFLDYAAEIGLLRKVGGGYIFAHRYLLDYFAALEAGAPSPKSTP